MCSPPTTSNMLITIVSEMSLNHFVASWHHVAEKDGILGFFMSQMRWAEVVRGTTVGVTLEKASLIKAAPAS